MIRELDRDSAQGDQARSSTSSTGSFIEKDALLAEINPLVTTPQGVFAADAKIIVDDNALGRQGIHGQPRPL